jgi:ABC-type glutathione transport system ATPase component
MPRFDILKTVSLSETFRVKQVLGSFDMNPGHANSRFSGEIPIEDMEWQIGAVVGRSGTGKSTIARTLWPDFFFEKARHANASVIDDFPNSVNCTRLFEMLYKVGLGSPPSWLRPYSALSCGEQMRIDCVDALLRYPDLVVMDEFTSVVDRRVAQIASYAIGKMVRKTSGRLIVVSCHRDFLPWLGPDWVFDTDVMQMSKKNDAGRRSNSSYETATEAYGLSFDRIII